MVLDLAGPAGRLEALVEVPEKPGFAAAICHPHPLYGGTLHNHATYRIAKAVLARGGVALRFNFRGVGRSAGRHDGGRGEVEDARAALGWLEAEHPELPRLACGFSFGARTALECACGDAGVSAILAAGLAVKMFDMEVARRCPKRVAVVQARRDEYGGAEEVGRLLAGATGPRRLWVVEGATHLFTEDLDGLQKAAEDGLSWLLDAR
jgi:alpha/beta superfamily hydrolase